MAVTAVMVKTLREKTGAGMMDCKKALTETDGDLEGAVDWLRKKGLSAASKKSARIASEGKVVVAASDSRGVLLEVNSETDFCAKNDHFVAFAQTAVEVALAHGITDVEALKEIAFPGTGRNIGEELTHQIATIGENMSLRRLNMLEVGQGVVASYIHMGGKIGVLVGLESAAEDRVALEELGRRVAMHVAASSPSWLDRGAVSADALERERAVLTEQARASGKPENIIDKMVVGRLNKFYAETCLVDQAFVMDPDQSVSQVVAAAAKGAGAAIRISGFARFTLGEGLQKKEEDFAAEVAKQVG